MENITKEEREIARQKLRKIIGKATKTKPRTVYVIKKHERDDRYVWSLYVFKNNRHFWITRLAAKASASEFDEEFEGIVNEGGGMDMAFDIVDTVARSLWPKDLGAYNRLRHELLS